MLRFFILAILAPIGSAQHDPQLYGVWSAVEGGVKVMLSFNGPRYQRKTERGGYRVFGEGRWQATDGKLTLAEDRQVGLREFASGTRLFEIAVAAVGQRGPDRFYYRVNGKDELWLTTDPKERGWIKYKRLRW